MLASTVMPYSEESNHGIDRKYRWYTKKVTVPLRMLFYLGTSR